MYPFLLKLKNRSKQLGNNVRKYVRSIELYGDVLVRSLEQKGLIDQVHLWKEARNPASEMDVILSLGNSRAENLNLLGCYYAIQFLHMNLRALDSLFMDLTARQDKFRIYKNMQFQMGINFRRLNTDYLSKLLDLFFGPAKLSEFAICGVGTRYDLDDLDLGIIDDASGDREQLNMAISHLSSEMMKWAIPLHLHLSQYVGEPGFTASIKEYQELLEREIHDFIIISEMLGAKLIIGSKSLFTQFEEQVTARYYYRPDQDNIYHEGYLRGLLGEVRSQLLQQKKTDVINPKEDGIRMIRGLVYSEKAIFSIKSANNYEILAELKRQNIKQKSIFEDLEKALLFFETFRFLYQMLIIQDEEIPLQTEKDRENLKVIAEYMGYGEIGCVDAYERLLAHYFEYVALAKEKTEPIFDLVTNHLHSISVFSHLKKDTLSIKDEAQSNVNVAEKFAELTHFFRRTKFWDDVIKTLEVDEAAFLQKLVHDLLALPDAKKAATIERYIEISQYSFYALLSFIMLITKNIKRLPDKNLHQELNDSLFRSIKGTSDEARRLAKVFSHYPLLLNDYLNSLSEHKQKEFIKFLDVQIWEEETAKFQKKLLALARLSCCVSKYFKRFFQRVVTKYPECILYLNETATLTHIANGLFGEVERHTEIKAQKDALGDYYNIEFLRTGIELLNGAPISYVNAEFTDFSDTYMQMLFDICRMEIDEEWAQRIATYDLLAIYVAGGHARGQAFDDDYDIIIILNSDDEQIKRYASGIVSRMNAEIIKRGVLPHFRFSEYTGYYITTMSDLVRILAADSEVNFIDKAQLLGARRVVGSTLLDTKFKAQIVQPYIIEQKTRFIQDMIKEMESRHEKKSSQDFVKYNIKECLGGLRDIEMLFLILKAKFELLQPISNELIAEICDADPAHSSKYMELKQLFDSLKHLRDIHRLTVTADNTLDPDYLDTPARILGCPADKETEQTQNLLRSYHSWTEKADGIIRSIFNDLGIVYS